MSMLSMRIAHMKVLRSLLLGYVLLAAPAATAQTLRDTSQHWAGTCIEHLAQRKQLNGYPDGRFRPENRLTARSMPS
ncbi:MAG: S-layer homology domain-containing protein [Synechococcales cyanobacterium RU_4_20]|nr:S-layer homology domain-containing protein [Synechococcales cyanobacterium RU_4_20]